MFVLLTTGEHNILLHLNRPIINRFIVDIKAILQIIRRKSNELLQQKEAL